MASNDISRWIRACFPFFTHCKAQSLFHQANAQAFSPSLDVKWVLYTLSEHSASVTCVAIAKRDCLQQSHPKATASQLTIASGSQDKTIKIWQFE